MNSCLPRFRTCLLLLSLFTVALLPTGTAAQATGATDADRLRIIDAYLEQARQDWEIPGFGFAIVRNDSVIFARGYGNRTYGRNEPVDEHTMFAIGSSSKAFTAAAIAMLVDEHRLSWSDRASAVLPALSFREEYVTRELTVRDLLAHSSGLSRYDQLWGLFGYDPAEIVRRVQYIEPTTSFRSAFGYQNLMYLAAGEVVRAKDGRSWDDFVSQRLFRPLGMTRSNTSIRSLEGMANVATPHARVADATVAIPYRNIDNIGPAGSINSSAREMAEWVRLQLGGGMHNGRRLLSDTVMREMHTPVTLIRRTPQQAEANPYSHFSTYGMGWFLEDHRGRRIVHHGGNIDGMSALVAMMPGENVGFVLLENMNGSGMRMPLMYWIFDRFIDAEVRDWSAEALQRQREARERAAASGQPAGGGPARVEGTRPSRDNPAYAGTWTSDAYGDLLITVESGRLVVRGGANNAIHVELEHWHYDTFRSRNLDPDAGALRGAARMFITFALDERGNPRVATISGLGDFRRRPAN
jgi:CubicO group peptidase (beta-lactamase class C family)